MRDIFSDAMDVAPRTNIHTYKRTNTYSSDDSSGFSWTAVIALVVVIIIIIFLIPQLIGFSKNLKNPTEGFTNILNPTKLPFNKCFVINLVTTDEGKRRWDVIKKHPQFKDYVTRFPAIYGKTYNYSNLIENGVIRDWWDKGKWEGGRGKMIKMSPGEVGCVLSHYFVWKRIVEERIPVAMVLEDDAINTEDNLLSVIRKEISHLPKNWDIFLLGFWMHTGDLGIRINPHIYKVKEFALTHSYLISLEGAKKLLNLLPIDMPIDSWMSSQSKMINIYRHNRIINKFSLRPGSRLIRQDSEISEISHTNNWKR